MENSEQHIRETTLMDVVDVLTNFTTTKIKEKSLRFYTGIVEDNIDPLRLGKCRIRVYGVFSDEIPTSDIPWALPDFNFIGSTIGNFIVPPIGAVVKVYFEKDDIYRPLYTTKVIDTNNLSLEKDEDYPDSMVFFETDIGDMFKINRKTAETTYRHASGLVIQIDKSGNMIINNSNTTSGEITITTKGDLNLKSEKGNVNISAPKGYVNLGASLASQSIHNTPVDIVTGAPLAINNQLQGKVGSVRVPS